MLYHKIPFENGKTKLVELYEDEIITYCPKCGKEYQLELDEIAEIINDGGDFSSTTYYCNGCHLKVVK